MDPFELTIVETLDKAERYRQAHLRARYRWGRVSNVLLASIAIAGALSAGSALSKASVAAAVLGITTAVLSGTNAGLQPADAAARHRTAATGYATVFRRLERLLVSRAHGGTTPRELVAELSGVDADIGQIETEAPSVKPTADDARGAKARVSFILTGDATPSSGID